MGTKFCGLTAMDIFVDTLVHRFQIILNITKVNRYFVGILNSWIALPTKYIKNKCPMNKKFFTGSAETFTACLWDSESDN